VLEDDCPWLNYFNKFVYKQATSLLATPELKVAVTWCHTSKTFPINTYSKSTNHSWLCHQSGCGLSFCYDCWHDGSVFDQFNATDKLWGWRCRKQWKKLHIKSV